MTKEEIDYAIRLVDLALIQLDGPDHSAEARNTLRSLRRLLVGPPELLRRRSDATPGAADATPGAAEGGQDDKGNSS